MVNRCGYILVVFNADAAAVAAAADRSTGIDWLFADSGTIRGGPGSCSRIANVLLSNPFVDLKDQVGQSDSGEEDLLVIRDVPDVTCA